MRAGAWRAWVGTTTSTFGGGAAILALAGAALGAGVARECIAPLHGPDPYGIDLVPTAHANGARGTVALRFAEESPFGVAVTPAGHHLYDAVIETVGLRAGGRALVVWAATPELDQVQKLGTLDVAGALGARIGFNKFLVFVTSEASPDVERWAGPILLRGISPSGRMHTMAGHGPFQNESCASVGFGRPGGGWW